MDAEDRRTVVFTATAHGLVHTYELSIPILMTVWLSEFSTTAAVLGLVVTVGYGLFGVGALPGGVLVDRFGSTPLIVGCLAGMAGSFLLLSASPSVAVVAVAIGLWGAAASVYHPAGLALLSKAVDRSGTAFGYHGIGGNVGIALGPLATAVLLLQFDWRTVAVALTVPAIVVAGYGFRLDIDESPAAATADGGVADSSTKGEIALSSVVSDTRVLATLGFGLVLVIVTTSGLYYRAFLTFLPDLLGDVLDGLVAVDAVAGDGPVGDEFDLARYLYVAILMVGIGGQYLGGSLADRVRPERALQYVLVALSVLALLCVVASGSVPLFVAVTLVLGLTLFTVQPLQQAAVAAYSDPSARGLSFGYTFLAIFGVGALGAGLAGTVLTFADESVLFAILAATAAVGAAVSATLSRVGEPLS